MILTGHNINKIKEQAERYNLLDKSLRPFSIPMLIVLKTGELLLAETGGGLGTESTTLDNAHRVVFVDADKEKVRIYGLGEVYIPTSNVSYAVLIKP